jgi:hypothetical protein
VAQGEGPEFKPQYHKKREKEILLLGYILCVERDILFILF